MRIRRLDLLRFGPFTGQSLSFDGDSGAGGLHLIYGPNEAGKSSALRALQQLLFGIPGEKSCRDHFRHSHKDLRVGGEFETADGKSFTVIRRNGGKNSLRDSSDKSVVDPAKLAALLGNMDGDRFRTQFGIDYEQLTAGGRNIVNGKGDLGTSLFAAGSGSGDLIKKLKSLEQECEVLFKSGGSKPRINAGISQLRDARKAIRNAQLSAADWKSHNEARQKALADRERIDDEMLQIQASLIRLQNIHEALPLIVQLTEAREQAESLKDVPTLREDFADVRRDTQTSLKAAQTARNSAEEQIRLLTEAVEQLTISDELLQHGAAIEDLFADLGRYRELLTSIPKLQNQQQQHEQTARDLLRELNLPPELDQADSLRIGVAERQQIRDLAGNESAVQQSLTEAQKRVAKAEAKLQKEVAAFEALNDEPDGRQLAAAVKKIQKHGNLEKQLRDANSSLQQQQNETDRNLKKLLQWPGTLLELEQIAVPSVDVVSTFEKKFDDSKRAAEKLEDKRRDIKKTLSEINGDLQKLTLQQDVPTEQDLTDSRKLRDDAWQLIRRTLDGEDCSEEIAQLLTQFESVDHLTDAYELIIARADETADRLRREAERVADKARLIGEQYKLDAQLTNAETDLQQNADAHAQLQADWEDLWQPAGIAPRSPGEMKEWLTHYRQIIGSAEEQRTHQRQADALVDEIQTHRTELSRLLESAGRSVSLDDVETLHALLEMCEATADELTEANKNRKNRCKEIERLEGELSDAQHELEVASNSEQAWKSDWSVAVAALDSSGSVTASVAAARLDVIDKLIAEIGAAQKLQEQITQHTAETERFEAAVAEVVERTSHNSDDASCAIIVARLNELLTASRKAEATRSSKLEQLETEHQKQRDANAEIRNHSDMLDELCREADVSDVQQLTVVELQCKKRRDVEKNVADVETQLQRLAGGEPLDKFVSDAKSEDQATLLPRIDQFNEQLARLRDDVKVLSEKIGEENTALNRMDGSAAAARASEDAEQVLATLRDDTEEFIRLKLATVILQKSIERYRQNNQGPVLQRASRLFRELTLGAFDGLQPDFADSGEAVLMGVRGSGSQLVSVDGMSEGTCDQLYLALRIASLEAYFETHDPVPFIVDDILIQFDDDRSAAALNVLAELSTQTQVIMFTHHQHLVELAEQQTHSPQKWSVLQLGCPAEIRP